MRPGVSDVSVSDHPTAARVIGLLRAAGGYPLTLTDIGSRMGTKARLNLHPALEWLEDIGLIQSHIGPKTGNGRRATYYQLTPTPHREEPHE